MVGRKKSFAADATLSRSSDGKVWSEFSIEGFKSSTYRNKYWQDTVMSPDGKYVGVCKVNGARVSNDSGVTWTAPLGQEQSPPPSES